MDTQFSSTPQPQPQQTASSNGFMSSVLFNSPEKGESLPILVKSRALKSVSQFFCPQTIVFIVVGVICVCFIVVALLVCLTIRYFTTRRRHNDVIIDGNPLSGCKISFSVAWFWGFSRQMILRLHPVNCTMVPLNREAMICQANLPTRNIFTVELELINFSTLQSLWFSFSFHSLYWFGVNRILLIQWKPMQRQVFFFFF